MMGQNVAYIIYPDVPLSFVAELEDRAIFFQQISESPERGEMKKLKSRQNFRGQGTLRAPELLAAHSKFRDEIWPRISDDDQHAREPSGSLHLFRQFGKEESNFRSIILPS